jgi:acetoin utilization protein AcuB
MRIQEIMNTNVHVVPATESASSAWELLRQRRIHHLVVTRGGRVAGVVSDRDLGGPRGAALRERKIVAHLMTPFVLSAKPTTTVRQAANMLRGYGIGCLPVMESGKLRGIITISDLLDLLGRGSERPVPATRRWTLRHRGQGRRKMRVRR